MRKRADRAALRKRLEQAGHRLTATRLAVWEALHSCEGHVTADDLVAHMHADGANIGRMTVYRTLDLLAELGLVRPAYQGTGAAHYILLQDGHHHHLVCGHCDRTIEFDDCGLGELGRTVSARYGFAIEGHLLEFYGTCADCQAGAQTG